jgi:hypothetical protein
MTISLLHIFIHNARSYRWAEEANPSACTYSATGPNPRKVAILLEALRLPFQLRLWGFGDAQIGVKGLAFLKINENVSINPAKSLTLLGPPC